MAKAGKVQHWKHGWIPLDEFARRVLGKKKREDPAAVQKAAEERARSNREYNAWRASVGRPVDPDLIAMQNWGESYQASKTATTDPDEARRARYAAHLKATAAKRAATQKRYQAHLAATAEKRAATEARYLAAQNRKHR